MAHEFAQIANPDNIPNAVSSGYQQQNTNLYVLQTGLDTTEPNDDGNGKITIPVGGIVECNGVMFKIISEINLNKPNINIAYWIEIIINNKTATAQLVTRPGKWNPAKNGCYTTNNNRTLNWVSLGNIANPIEQAVFSKTVKGTWRTQFKKGWYLIDLGSGFGGGNGTNGSGQTGGGVGGVASTSNRVQKIIFSNGEENIIKVGGSGTNGAAASNGTASQGAGGIGGGGDGGRGGGGGSGAGEETSFNEITALAVPPGIGGNGANGGSVNGGGIGGDGGAGGVLSNRGHEGNRGGSFADNDGGIGGIYGNVSAGYLGGASGGGGGGGGGGSPGNNGHGGNGGNGGAGGISGYAAAKGTDGGYCTVIPLAA